MIVPSSVLISKPRNLVTWAGSNWLFSLFKRKPNLPNSSVTTSVLRSASSLDEDIIKMYATILMPRCRSRAIAGRSTRVYAAGAGEIPNGMPRGRNVRLPTEKHRCRAASRVMGTW